MNTYTTSPEDSTNGNAVTDPDIRQTPRKPSSTFRDIVDHVVQNERDLYSVYTLTNYNDTYR